MIKSETFCCEDTQQCNQIEEGEQNVQINNDISNFIIINCLQSKSEVTSKLVPSSITYTSA